MTTTQTGATAQDVVRELRAGTSVLTIVGITGWNASQVRACAAANHITIDDATGRAVPESRPVERVQLPPPAYEAPGTPAVLNGAGGPINEPEIDPLPPGRYLVTTKRVHREGCVFGEGNELTEHPDPTLARCGICFSYTWEPPARVPQVIDDADPDRTTDPTGETIPIGRVESVTETDAGLEVTATVDVPLEVETAAGTEFWTDEEIKELCNNAHATINRAIHLTKHADMSVAQAAVNVLEAVVAALAPDLDEAVAGISVRLETERAELLARLAEVNAELGLDDDVERRPTATPADVREWAIANNVPVSTHGRIAHSTYDAFEAAHPGVKAIGR